METYYKGHKLAQAGVIGLLVLLGLGIVVMIGLAITAIVLTLRVSMLPTANSLEPKANSSAEIRYVPEVFYLTPSHNNFPATIQIKSPDDTRFAVTGVGEIFNLRLIKQSDGQIVYQQLFVMDKPMVRGAIFCLFGVEYSTSRCAPIPEKEWKEGDYIFDVVASYASGGRNSNQRQLHFGPLPPTGGQGR